MYEVQVRVDGRSFPLTPIRVVTHSRGALAANEILRPQLEGLESVQRAVFGDWQVDPALMRTVVDDALASDLLFTSQENERPYPWSPLGSVRPDSFGRLETFEDMFGPDDESYRLRGGRTLADGAYTWTLEGQGTAVAAAGFHGDAFVVPVPEGTDTLTVSSDPTTLADRESDLQLREALEDEVSGPVYVELVWRLYLGANTMRIDGSTPAAKGLHRLGLGGTRTAGLLVGRLVYAIPARARSFRQDPFWTKRLKEYEQRDRATAAACPRVELAIRPPGGALGTAVVAIHGTMACAVPLARFLRSTARPGLPVLRLEHDTWAPVDHNAGRLAGELRRLGTTNVLLVGHSRGGLVARHTAQLLRAEMQVEVLTLGTPFLGTPLIRGVERGLLGVRALLGGLRLATASPFVDTPTRLLGWMVRGKLPDGLAAMAEDSAYLRLTSLYDQSDVRRVAGRVPSPDAGDSYGLGFLSTFSDEAFGSLPHDLVVGVDSASAGRTDAVTVPSDHFSFLQDPVTAAEFTALARRLPSQFYSVESETLNW